jgi:hypothetical protein
MQWARTNCGRRDLDAITRANRIPLEAQAASGEAVIYHCNIEESAPFMYIVHGLNGTSTAARD